MFCETSSGRPHRVIPGGAAPSAGVPALARNRSRSCSPPSERARRKRSAAQRGRGRGRGRATPWAGPGCCVRGGNPRGRQVAGEGAARGGSAGRGKGEVSERARGATRADARRRGTLPCSPVPARGPSGGRGKRQRAGPERGSGRVRVTEWLAVAEVAREARGIRPCSPPGAPVSARAAPPSARASEHERVARPRRVQRTSRAQPAPLYRHDPHQGGSAQVPW